MNGLLQVEGLEAAYGAVQVVWGASCRTCCQNPLGLAYSAIGLHNSLDVHNRSHRWKGSVEVSPSEGRQLGRSLRTTQVDPSVCNMGRADGGHHTQFGCLSERVVEVARTREIPQRTWMGAGWANAEAVRQCTV